MRFASRLPRFSGKSARAAAVALLLILGLYYPIGMLIVHKVDDDPAFGEGILAQGKGSAAVETVASLMEREIDRHWAPNDPFFYPGAALTRMPAFQRGVVSASARFALMLADQLGRARGTSSVDPDAQKALGFLNYPPNVWFYDSSVSWLPVASSEAQYRSAVTALRSYNNRVAEGQATFDRRADNLLDALERITADLGSSSASIDAFVHERSVFAFGGAGSLYYETKGKMYAYFLILRALEHDFAPVVEEKQLQSVWKNMLESLYRGMELGTVLVINADPDSMLAPSHLAAQGFYVLRARAQLREITNILLK